MAYRLLTMFLKSWAMFGIAMASTSPPAVASTDPSIDSGSTQPNTIHPSSLPPTTPSSEDGNASVTSSPVPTQITQKIQTTMQPHPTQENNSLEAFHNLTQEFFRWKVQDNPEFASGAGINEENAAHLDSLSLEQFEQRKLKNEDFLQRAKSMDTSTFPEGDLLSYKIFVMEIESYLQNFKHLKFFAPLAFLQGPQLSLNQLVKKSTVLNSKKDFQNLLSRYNDFPRQADEIIALMQGNMASGLMPSNWSLGGVSEKIISLLVPHANESVFYEPFLTIDINITTGEIHTLREQAQQAVTSVLSAFTRIDDFFQKEYFPKARTVEGVSSLAGGLEYYKDCLKFYTSTDMTPQQIHALGLAEVERILEEVAQTAIDLGMPNKTISEISNALAEDPRQKYASKEDLISNYRHVVYNVIYPLMDQVVNVVPDVNVTIEETLTGGYASYKDPPYDLSRPGTFYIGADKFEQHRRYEVTALSLHEAVPGHHLQAVNLILNPSVPDFRKYSDHHRYTLIPVKYPMHIGFSEGWGLYSEFLGNELGLYKDPLQRLGRHSWELLRASRLVVDTGLHAFGWTRQKAINYLLENTALSKEAIKGQVNRYISWPGQACSYKVGEVTIKRLRRLAEEALGQHFRVQDFHDTLLGCIGPLNILEECVNTFIRDVAAMDVASTTEDGVTLALN